MRRYAATFRTSFQGTLGSTDIGRELTRDLLALVAKPVHARSYQQVWEGELLGILALAYGKGTSAVVRTYLQEGSGRVHLNCEGRVRPAYVLALVARHYGTKDVELDLPWGSF